MEGQRIGYVRVSTVDQHPARQLEHVPVTRLFTDTASGKDTKRPALEALLAYVRTGDTVVVQSMDRLARNLDDLRRLVDCVVPYDATLGKMGNVYRIVLASRREAA